MEAVARSSPDHRRRPGTGEEARLYETPQNPIPLGALVSYVRTQDGLMLRATRWKPAGEPRGTVAIFPGHAEFTEKYCEVVQELLDRNFVVAALDWRGQGGSARELPNARKGHVDDFSHYGRDLAAFTSGFLRPYCPEPWFGLAHSMGGAVLVAAAHDGTSPFVRLVLVAPMLEIAVVRNLLAARVFVQTLDALGFGGAFVPGGSRRPINSRRFEANPLTSDPVRYARTAEIIEQAPHLAVGAPTIGWINAAFRLCARFKDPEYPRRILTPTLVFACGADRVVDTPAVERFATQLKAGWHVLVPYARHELLMERDPFRQQFWAAFDAFVPGTRSEMETLAIRKKKKRRRRWL